MLKSFAIACLALSATAGSAMAYTPAPTPREACIATVKSHYKTAWAKLEPQRQTLTRLKRRSIGSERPGSREFASQLAQELAAKEAAIVQRFRTGSLRCNQLVAEFVPDYTDPPVITQGGTRFAFVPAPDRATPQTTEGAGSR